MGKGILGRPATRGPRLTNANLDARLAKFEAEQRKLVKAEEQRRRMTLPTLVDMGCPNGSKLASENRRTVFKVDHLGRLQICGIVTSDRFIAGDDGEHPLEVAAEDLPPMPCPNWSGGEVASLAEAIERDQEARAAITASHPSAWGSPQEEFDDRMALHNEACVLEAQIAQLHEVARDYFAAAHRIEQRQGWNPNGQSTLNTARAAAEQAANAALGGALYSAVNGDKENTAPRNNDVTPTRRFPVPTLRTDPKPAPDRAEVSDRALSLLVSNMASNARPSPLAEPDEGEQDDTPLPTAGALNARTYERTETTNPDTEGN